MLEFKLKRHNCIGPSLSLYTYRSPNTNKSTLPAKESQPRGKLYFCLYYKKGWETGQINAIQINAPPKGKLYK